MPLIGKGVGINAYNLKGQGILILYPERLFDGSGEVTEWYRARALELQENLRHNSRHTAAMGQYSTGRMRRSIKVLERRTGPLSRTINVRFGVKYAAYTDQGTKTPIKPKFAKVMPVGKSQGANVSRGLFTNRGANKVALKKQVKGQRGTHWVRESINDTTGFHGYRG